MSARNYAEKNAGRRVRVYVSNAGPNRRLIKYPICRVVGYADDGDDESIYVEFEDQPLHQYCTNPVNIHDFVRTAESNTPGVWRFEVEQVRYLRRAKTQKTTKPIKAYPHTCKKCHSPARNCSNYVLCSNARCLSNKKFKQVILSKIPKMTRIKCPTCRGNAISSGAARNKDGGTGWRFSCAKKHTWAYTPKVNDILSSSPQDGKDRVWQINGWQIL